MNALLRFLLRSLAFAAFALVVYVVLIGVSGIALHPALRRNLVYPRGGYGDMWTRIHDLRDQGPVDVLVVGGSHVYRGFDPRIFAAHGLSLYNLGSSAQSMLQTEVLLDRYLDQLDPKLTIIEVYPGTFGVDGVESSLDLIANAGVDLPMARMALRVGNIKTINALIYSSERQLLGLDAHFSEAGKHAGQTDTYVRGGFLERRGGGFTPSGKAKTQNVGALPEQLGTLQRILDRLAETHHRVVLVEAPITHWRYAAYRDHASHEQRMAALGPYLNFNGLPNLVDSVDFYDNHHLNQHGVAVFNQALLDSLDRHGLLPTPGSR